MQPVWEQSSTKVTAERRHNAVDKFSESLWKVRGTQQRRDSSESCIAYCADANQHSASAVFVCVGRRHTFDLVAPPGTSVLSVKPLLNSCALDTIRLSVPTEATTASRLLV